jgi:hypothetical protein
MATASIFRGPFAAGAPAIPAKGRNAAISSLTLAKRAARFFSRQRRTS